MQFPFLKSKEPQKNFFISLLIKPFKIGAILFEEINSKLFILSTHELETEKETADLSSEDLLLISDKAISFVEGSLPEKSSVEKTIFSVPYDWVEEGKIKKEHLVKLKKVCEDLGLVPIGYLMTIEAIVHFLQKSEGAPVSAVFIETGQNKIFVYLVRAGKILEVVAGIVEENVLKTVEKLLKKIESVDILPSKIILLDYKGVEGVQHEFLSHSWQKEIPFLHLPQIMVLEKGFENEATINGVATQMQLEVLQDVKINEVAPEKEDILEETNPEEFGFVKERDIAEKGGVEIEDEIEKQELSDEPPVSYFKKDDEREDRRPDASLISAFLKRLKIPNTLRNVNTYLKPGGLMKPKVILGVIGVVIFAIASSFLYYNFILISEISIFADKKAVDKTLDLEFLENPQGENSIKIDFETEEIKGDETKNSTGKKETGEKAKGEATIYNKTEAKKTFPKGTILVANDLEFEVQDEVVVASTSSFSTTLSNAKGKILATKFGKEYNLPSNSNFTIKGASSNNYIGKNSDAITGGTKKETTVVSEKDLEDLLESIVEKLEKEALSKAQEQKDSNFELLPKAISFEVLEKKYTKKEGEESGNVGISARIEYQFGKYGKEDIRNVVDSLSRGEVPGTYALIEGESSVEITDITVDQKNKSASAKIKVNAIYSPKVESEELASGLRGKNESYVKKQIESIAGITDVRVDFRRTLPLFPKILPQNSKNIRIEVKN